MIDIDGSRGEGGGQILRTALALSAITGRAFRMRNIRAGRANPGLRRQHVACVDALARLCGATVHGAAVDSRYIEVTPGPVAGGELMIDIGTVGSTTLVVQTILLPAIVAKVPLRATIRGGTHNPMAPPFEFLDRVFAPHLRAMGAEVTLTLVRHGFASGDRGGPLGEIVLEVGVGALRAIELVRAGAVVGRRATAVVSRLPTHVADRELSIVRERLGEPLACETREITDAGTGNVLLLELEKEHARELVTGHGEKGVRAELVATRACEEAEAWLEADVPVGEHLADQLVLPLALAGGGRYRCAPLSLHATTNIETIGLFLDVAIGVEPDGDAVVVSVG